MNYEAMPKIRLEVESMKHAILQHMGVVGSELGQQMDKEIIRAIENYPWESKVREIVHESITKYVEQYFSFGRGRDAIKSAVEEGFKATLGKGNE